MRFRSKRPTSRRRTSKSTPHTSTNSLPTSLRIRISAATSCDVKLENGKERRDENQRSRTPQPSLPYFHLCVFYWRCVSGLRRSRRSYPAYTAGSGRRHGSHCQPGRRWRSTHLHSSHEFHLRGKTRDGARVDNYRAEGRVRFNDPIPPDEIKTHAGGPVSYIVRTRASQKRVSADSNVVSLRLFPVPAPIDSVEARVTESAIELTWSVPTSTSDGDPVSTLIGYRVYRSEASPPADSSSA